MKPIWGGKRLGYEGSSRACGCGENQKFVGRRAKTLATLLGSVTIRRSYYHCSRCGASAKPYDEGTGLGREAVSAEMAQAVSLLGVHHPFREAAGILKALTGQSLGFKTIHRLLGRVGAVASRQEEQAAERMQTWAGPPAEVQLQRLYVATDGTTVHQWEGFKEAKTVVCYGEDSRGQAVRRYAVRLESADVFKAHAWATACRCGLEGATETVLLGDGAAWIWDHVGPVLGERTTHIVDWYHAMEHVWDCGKALHGEGTERTAGWVKQIEAWLWDGQVRRILEALAQEQARARAPCKREALRRLMTYLRNQDARMAYGEFRARGLDIGSGQAEAACKHVVGARMKRAGMRWSGPGAQAVLSLRAAWLNDDWTRFWKQKPLAA